ncbi:MAG: hypothetical protein AAFY88_04615, partial [Acidobacteriota bacterium]
MDSPPAAARWRARLEGWFWDLSPLWRRPARLLTERLSILRYRWRARGRDLPVRVVHTPRRPTEPARDLWISGSPEAPVEEGLRMAAAAEDLDLVFAPGSRAVAAPLPGDAATAFGRYLPKIGAADPNNDSWPLQASGPYRLRPDTARGKVVRRPLYDVERALRLLPPVDGPPATL